MPDWTVSSANIQSATEYEFLVVYSKMHAVTDIISTAYDNLKDNKYSGFACLDITKAFDTVSHKY